MSDAPERPPSGPARPHADPGSNAASTSPDGARTPHSSPATDGRSHLLPWLVVIAALGGVWWWFAASEPAAPPTTKPPDSLQPELEGARRAATSATPGEWAEALKRRELSDVADRRSQAARHLLQRQGLGATNRAPDWNRARVPGVIVPKSASDAAAPPR